MKAPPRDRPKKFVPRRSFHRTALIWQDAEKVRQFRSRFAQRLNVPKRTLLASSLAAALLDSRFEHPVHSLLLSHAVEQGNPMVERVFCSQLA